MLKRKARLHKHAKRTGNFKEYRHFQKECKRQFRKAEWDHINNIISEGFENKNSKTTKIYTQLHSICHAGT